MSKISQLLGLDRRATAHPDPAQRRRAVERLSDANPRERQRLREVIDQDPDPQVRDAALGRLTDADTLVEYLRREATRAGSAQRIAHHLRTPDTDLEQRLRAEPALVILTAAHAALPDPLMAWMVADSADADQLAELAAVCVHTEHRLLAIDRIHHSEPLQRLERILRGRDKRAYRTVRERLANMRRTQAEEVALQQDLVRLCERMESLIASATMTLTRREATHLRAEWQTLTDRHQQLASDHHQPGSIEDCRERFEAAASALDAAMAEAAAQATAPQGEDGAATATDHPETAPAAPEPPAELHTAAAAVATLWHQVDAGLSDLSDPDALTAALQHHQSCWRQAATGHTPPADLAEPFHAQCQQLRTLLAAIDDLRRTLPTEFEPAPEQLPTDPGGCAALWVREQQAQQRQRGARRLLEEPPPWPPGLRTSAPYEQLHAQHAADRQLLALAREHASQLSERLDQIQQEIDSAISGGRLELALQLRQQGRTALRCLPESRQHDARVAFNLLAKRVEELRDWKNFATNPKRIALCEQMESLGTNNADPAARADQVKAVRAAWKALGPVQSDGDRSLATRLDAAAAIAFEPCRVYFEQQAARRAENAAHRERLCEELETFAANVDWQQVDWKAVDAIVRTARNDWHRFIPVDRAARKTQQSRFDQIMATIAERLQGEYRRNLAALEKIAATAEELLTADTAMAERIDTAKQLQQRWREVGVTPRAPQQQLWKRFRTASDALFQNRDAARQALVNRQQEHTHQAQQQLAELTAQLQADDHDGAADDAVRASLAAFANELANLDLPPAERQRNRQQVDRLTARLASRRQQRATARYRDELFQVVAAHRTIRANPDQDHDDLLSATPSWAHEGLRAAAPGNPPADDDETSHRLVIETEIIAGSASPEDDADRRMQVQLERLAGKAQNSNQDIETVLRDLVLRWITLPAPATPLAERFGAAMEAALAGPNNDSQRANTSPRE